MQGLARLYLFIITLTISNSFFAQVQYSLIIDKKLSEITGAEGNLFAHKIVYSFENKILKPKWTEENTGPQKALGIFYRLGKSFVLDYTLDYIFFLNQHERYGHGARLREFGFKGNSYECLVLPPPFGDGIGYAYFGNEGDRRISKDEDLAISFGGTEASAVMSNALRLKWMQKQEMNYRESLLYCEIASDLFWYITFDADLIGSDIEAYLFTLNSKTRRTLKKPYYNSYESGVENLRKQVLVNLLDPYYLFSCWAYARTYIIKGEENFKFPMIKMGTLNYLPAFRIGLTPFGTEFYFDNYFNINTRSYYFYIRYGEKKYYTFRGIGLTGNNLLRDKKLQLHANFNIWEQPAIAIGGEKITKRRDGFGGAFSTTFLYPISKKTSVLNHDWQLNVMGQFGYKTPGYLQGENLDEGPIIRLGLGFSEWN